LSDIPQVKALNGRPATFLRFDGPDRYVVDVDGDERTIARDEWRQLANPQPRVAEDKVSKGNLDRLG
jgi:hypothetical protein